MGAWPSARSIARAARWDGLVLQGLTTVDPTGRLDPTDLPSILASVDAHRPAELRDRPFEVIARGMTPASDPGSAWAVVARWREAGATWWIEAAWDEPSVERIRARIAAGPPPGAGDEPAA